MAEHNGLQYTGRRRALAAVAVSLLAGGALIGLPGNAAASVVFAANFEDGRANDFQLSGGHWTVSSDGSRVLRQTSSGAARATASHDAAWANYTVTARVKATSLSGSASAVGLIARVDNDAGYQLAIRKGNRIELTRVSGTVRTVIGSQVLTVRTSAWYQLSLSVMGAQLTATVIAPSGQVTLSVSDLLLSTGGIALFTERAAATFDDVVVDTADDTQPPSTPRQPQLLEVTPTTATITWPAATDNVGVTGYIIYHGSQMFGQREWRRVSTNDPVTLTLDSTGATLHFSVRAVDAAGNESPSGPWVVFPQPPTFPKSGDDVVAPTAPGAPVPISSNAVGTTITWAPATDNVGVVEYHVVHTVRLDEVYVPVKVPGNVTTALVPHGIAPNSVRIVAIDASWNRTSGPSAPLTPGNPTPGVPNR